MTPLRFDNLLEEPTELRKSLLLRLIIKDTTQEQPDGRNAQGKVCGTGCGACMRPPGMLPSQHPVPLNPESILNPFS